MARKVPELNENDFKHLLEQSQKNPSLATSSFTPEETKRFSTAFEDPEFRKLFTSYMDELQDPANREVAITEI